MAEPKQITIGGAPSGYNGRLSVPGYGAMVVRVATITYSLDIVTSEAASAHGKAFYPGWLNESAFSLEVMFATWAGREKFNSWMHGYMDKVTRNQISKGYMLVQVPARRFTRKAVPHRSLDYGDDVAQSGRLYRSQITFSGSSDPLAKNASSTFRNAKAQAQTSATFYPAGSQKAGAETLDSTLFDSAAPGAGTTFDRSRLDHVDRLLGDQAYY